MSERIVLDPAEIAASNRTQLDITDWIAQAGPDWGDSTITTFMAERDRGSIPVDFTVPNRDVSLPLVFNKTTGGTTVAQARANIQAKIALFQKEGGWIKRVLNTGGTYYADVVDGATHAFSSAQGWESAQNVDIDPSISLTCLPDFYQDEITLGDHVETTNAELVFTETGILGDYPGRVRIVVDDDQGQDQRGLIWAFRSRHYDSASTARIPYEAEALGPLDTAAKAALSGASGGTVVTHGTLATNWTPVLSTNVAGTQFLTHQGTYRLHARVYSTSGTTVQARAVWDVGDLVNPAENDAWRLPGASNFYDHDFGEVRLDAPPVGTYRWSGQIQAKGDVGGENFSVDKIWLVPADEGMGVLTAPIPSTLGLATYSARDEFNQTSGTIGTKVLPVGGTWAAAGATTGDFNLSGTPNFNVTRTPTNDVAGIAAGAGRFALAGTATYTNIVERIDLKNSALVAAEHALLARYTDTSNFMLFYIFSSATAPQAAIYKVVAGVTNALALVSLSALPVNTYSTLQGLVDTNGRASMWFGAQGGATTLIATAQDAVLATGGALATGKIGFWDKNGTTVADTRTYDNFQAWVPTPDAVTFASRSTQITTDGNFRLDSGGTAYGPVSVGAGDLARIPVAGLEGRTTEVFLKNSRGDFDQLPDSHTSTDYGDDVSAKVFYRPCYLNVGTA